MSFSASDFGFSIAGQTPVASEPTVTVNVPHGVPAQRIADLIIAALEGGSNYWCNRFRLIEPQKRVLSEKPWYASPELYVDPDMQIAVEDDEGYTHVIGAEHIKNALGLMASKHPTHFADFLQEQEDANTADIFLQLVVLKDVVYG
jgi:hypothetical protein